MQPPSASPFSKSSSTLRLAGVADLDALVVFEEGCFDEEKRDTRAQIRRSLKNSRNETWVLENADATLQAAMSIRFVRTTLRIYSLATGPEFRGKGCANQLLEVAKRRARETGMNRISLEADAALPDLLAWYERHGFLKAVYLADYYDENRHAWRMRCSAV